MTETQTDVLGIRPVRLSEDGRSLQLLDQRRLPGEECWLSLDTIEAIAEAIETLTVRGAPAIGCAAALGMAAASHGFPEERGAFQAATEQAFERLAATRPTAVNLFVALNEQRQALAALEEGASVATMRRCLRECAEKHTQADIASCLAIGEHGAALLPKEGGVLTHCNAGALATAAFGTALGVIRSAWTKGHRFRVYADETRPLLQGGRLTAWELQRDGIPVSVIADNMAGALMAQGKIQAAVVGADRIARNGDVANKIGTFSVAVLCHYHGIPLYVAAPWTTIDLALADGDAIPIETRGADEVRRHGGKLMTPEGIEVCNPAFDVTPAALVRAIITERGVFAPGSLAAR